MRIHLALLGSALLLVLAGPRPHGDRALVQGIPLGDLMRPTAPVTTSVSPAPRRAEVPTERNPTISQLGPSSGSSSGSSETFAPGTTTSMPSTSLGGATPSGLNSANPSLPTSSSTFGGVPTSTGVPPGDANGPVIGGGPSTSGAMPAAGSSTSTGTSTSTRSGATSGTPTPSGDHP